MTSHNFPARFLDLSVAASTASINAARKCDRSSWCTAEIVVPPGEQTASFSSPGCFPVWRTIFAAPCNQTWGIVAKSWWCQQMETFSALLAICAVNSLVSGEFPAQRPVPRSFDIFFDLRLKKQLSKQSWGWWFEMLSCPLWRHCNAMMSLETPFASWLAWVLSLQWDLLHIEGLVQERRNSSALAMELRLSCTNPPMCKTSLYHHQGPTSN